MTFLRYFNFIFLVNSIYFVNILGFTLIRNVKLDYLKLFPKVITPCKFIDSRLLTASLDAVRVLRNHGYPIYIYESDFNNGLICTFYDDDIYNIAYTMMYSNYSVVYIRESLLNYKETLFNVVMHELLHSIGLDHSIYPGMMSYSVNLKDDGSIDNDKRRLWLSYDDLNGLNFLTMQIYS